MITQNERKTLDRVISTIETLRDELQSTFDDKSERWQSSEAGQSAQAEIDTLDRAIDELNSL